MAGNNGQTTRIELPGASVDVVRKGSGQALFILHGGGGPVAAMPFVERLAESFEVIAPVHPGFAGSAIPDHFDDLQDLVFLYLDLMDALELEDAVMLGISMGGWTAMEIAVMSTARISKLILVDSVGVKVGGREDRDIADVFATPPEELVHLPDEALHLLRQRQVEIGLASHESRRPCCLLRRRKSGAVWQRATSPVPLYASPCTSLQGRSCK